MTRRVEELSAALDMARDEIARYRVEMAEAKEFQKRSIAMEEARSRLRTAESELDKIRTTVQIAQNARAAAEQARSEADRQALEARSHAEEMSAERDATAAELESCGRELEDARSRLEESAQLTAGVESSRRELDEARSQLKDCELKSRERERMLEQLRGALATMISERDAARAQADEAKAQIEQLVKGHLGSPSSSQASARHARPAESAPDVGGTEPASPPGPVPTLPPGHDLGGVSGTPDLFRRQFPPLTDE